ncbi:MAG: GNAT family N-acetyltransferase [Naasia sp.]
MQPVVLRTERLVLDQLREADVDDVARYCQEPVMSRYMTLPSPYRREDAEFFVSQHVPAGWRSAEEFTWAIRGRGDDALLGVVAHRTALCDLGYWLGAEHRGNGYMAEAVDGVLSWLAVQGTRVVTWECLVGNRASAAIARRTGFRYTGTGPSNVVFRDGSQPPAWHGVRDADHPVDHEGPWPEESY